MRVQVVEDEVRLAENLSRIYLGIHWLSDASTGILEENQVADYVSKNLFRQRIRVSFITNVSRDQPRECP